MMMFNDTDPVSFEQTRKILARIASDQPTRDAWVAQLRGAAPEATGDLKMLHEHLHFNFNEGYLEPLQDPSQKRRYDELSARLRGEFAALTDDEKIAHYAIAAFCKTYEAAQVMIEKLEPKDIAEFRSDVAAHMEKVVNPQIRATRIERENAHVIRIAMLPDGDIAKAFSDYAGKADARNFSQIEIDGRRVTAKELAEFVRTHGTPVASPTQDVTANTIVHTQESSLGRGMGDRQNDRTATG